VLVTIAAMALAGPAAAYTTYIADLSPTAHAFTAGSDNSVMASATLVFYPGAGVTNADSESTSSPQHSMDNDGRFEFIRIDFGAGNSSILDKVITSWVQNDADITVLARTGNAGSADPNGKTIDGANPADPTRLANNGWELVGHYNSTITDDIQEIDVNASNTAARYWLIGAYDPDFGGSANGASHGYGKYDYLKILKVKWDKPTDAAEPATLLLFAAGFIAWLSSRRRTARV
jgi:hypothetical protein